ncbi:MAG: trypsin-like peptidase domain-containing protein [Candidatus Hydrogenedentes bacterium]|nr:trypsin-like peptidase domain-containing protein [Candidatus Hydrogenedentota bacterium]
MKHFSRRTCLLWVAAFACLAARAWAGEVEDQGRAVFDKYKHTVVTVQLVVKQKFSMEGMPSQEEESKAEVTGTVISPEGLTVVALSSTDPTSIYKNMMGGQGEDFQMTSEVSDVRILLHDGKEVRSQIVLRDVDLDLAFVRPVDKPETPFEFVNLEETAEPQLLDILVTLNRLNKVANRVYSASFERVNAIVERPRKFYIPGDDITTTEQGSPAFTLDGKVVGVFVIRSIRDTGGGGSGMFGRGNENVSAIILPSADVKEGAAQVPAFGEAPVEPPAEEPAPETATPEEAAPEETVPETEAGTA